MTLDELVLHNVGVYAGRHVLQLSPLPGTPVILLGGLNGTGKTTILDALNLVLYGKLADCTRRARRSYEHLLRDTISRSATRSEASIELTFHHLNSEGTKEYRILRRWSAKSRGVQEYFEVHIDGRHDPGLSETWTEYVETFLPRGIANLFFFDGERIERLADLHKSRNVLRTGVHSLLGVDVLDQLQNDLSVLRRRKLSEATDNNTRAEIDSLVTAVQQSEAGLQSTDQTLGQLRNDLDHATKTLADLDAKFQAEGGELADKQEALESERRRIHTLLSETAEEMRQLAVGCAPLALVAPFLHAAREQALRERTATDSSRTVSLLAKRDDTILSLLREHHTPQQAVTAIQSLLERDRTERLHLAKCDEFLHFDDTTLLSLTTLLDQRLPQVIDRARELLQLHRELESELQPIQKLIADIPTEERLRDLRIQRSELCGQVERIRHDIDESNGRRSSLLRELSKNRSTLEGALQETAEELQSADTNKRIATYSQRASTTLDRLRSQLVGQHIEQISKLSLKSFNTLLHKETLLDRLEICPDTYSLSLHHAGGAPIDPVHLSAGERQLLAVSLLWGLAQASGRPLPTVIDTPLGRLDSSHRDRLVERYFPEVSHQVILLSTDREIDRDQYNRLASHVARSYHLVFDDACQTTQVEEGFFWNE